MHVIIQATPDIQRKLQNLESGPQNLIVNLDRGGLQGQK